MRDWGTRTGAEASRERALALAEPDGIILPFALTPVHRLLARRPRHRIAHTMLVRAISDVLAVSSAPRRSRAVPLVHELSEAELRVVRYLPAT